MGGKDEVNSNSIVIHIVRSLSSSAFVSMKLISHFTP